MQVVTCQWSVVIQLLEFHNPMNIETRINAKGKISYCCCDTGISNCTSQAIFLNNTCENKCDTFFVVNLNNTISELSTISTFNESILNSPSHSLYVKYILNFTLDVFPILVSYTNDCTVYRFLK